MFQATQEFRVIQAEHPQERERERAHACQATSICMLQAGSVWYVDRTAGGRYDIAQGALSATMALARSLGSAVGTCLPSGKL